MVAAGATRPLATGARCDGEGDDMRRIDNARELRELADELGVRRDWHEPDEQLVTARVAGVDLDNAGFWPPSEVGIHGYTGELCVIISQDSTDVAAGSLASLLAMASGPDGPLA